MMTGSRLCERHAQRLNLALELRGLGHPRTVEGARAHLVATEALARHAMNLAGSAAGEMLRTTHMGDPWCPLCFINQKNPARHNFDDWVDEAANEVLAASRQDAGAMVARH